MTSAITKAEKERVKLVQEKCQEILSELLRDDDNKYCVDCDAKGPRWASWNLGVFVCIRCAGIHRNLGVHISKVKSINLDSWTPEQVGSIQAMGNSKARAVYEANLPDGHRRPQSDSSLEQFIRCKYEQKKYIAKEWIQPPIVPAFDIDEEVKKDKEKKRQTGKVTSSSIRGVASVSATSEQNNSVPRPVSNPASTTISADKVPKNSTNPINSLSGSKSNNDLLGINFGEPSSNSVLEVPNVQSSAKSNSDSDLFATAFDTSSSKAKSSEEDDFFNQKIPDSSKKLDTSSILKLYESSSNPIGGFGGQLGGPITAQQNAFGTFPANFGGQATNPVPFAAQATNPVAAPFAGLGNFVAPSTAASAASIFSSNNSGIAAPPTNTTNPFLIAPAGPAVPQPQVNLNQQLGSLQLNSNLVSNWLSTNSSSNHQATPMAPNVSNTDNLFNLGGPLNQLKSSSSLSSAIVPPATSANPFMATSTPAASNNGFGNFPVNGSSMATSSNSSSSNFATFPSSTPANSSSFADFSSLGSMFPAPPSSATNSSSNVASNSSGSDFGNLNWANFGSSSNPGAPVTGVQLPITSSILPSSDLWQ